MNKGQASIEYLGTYAWAFLGLLVTLGAMSYFGVFNPNSYSPESCETGAQVECRDFTMVINENQASFLLELLNNYDKSIVINNMWIDDMPFELYNPKLIIDPGRTGTMIMGLDSSTLSVGERDNIEFVIEYKRKGGMQYYNLSGNALVETQRAEFSISTTSGEISFADTDEFYFCGDGFIDGTEDCDIPTIYDNGLLGPFQTPSGEPYAYHCKSDCTFWGSCGDGIDQPNEECEQTQNPSVACEPAPSGRQYLRCTSCTCVYETIGPTLPP